MTITIIIDDSDVAAATKRAQAEGFNLADFIQLQVTNQTKAWSRHDEEEEAAKIAILTPLGNSLLALPKQDQETLVSALIDKAQAAGQDTTALQAFAESLTATPE